MTELKTIEVPGFSIRLVVDEEDTTQLKPHIGDICVAVGLEHLKTDDQLKKLFDMLFSGKHKEALKLTCYGSDLNIPEAKLRLIRFLTIGLGCLLILNDDRSDNEVTFNQHRDFINGIFGFPFTNDQILNLVKAELPGYDFNIDID